MIPLIEIKEKARLHEVPASTIERDYAQNWLLKHISSINMAFKDGTSLRKEYFDKYRFSDDLDFTLLEKISKQELENSIRDIVTKTKKETGINFLNEIHIEDVDNGFMGKIYFQILRTSGSPTKIKLDFTKNENEKMMLPIETKYVIHPYSDSCQFQINVYSLEEIVAEKIRSLFQRTRPRDLYDVWYLYNYIDSIDKKIILTILPLKFEIKKVEFDISSFEKKEDDFKRAWKNSLSHQLKELPNFDDVFKIVYSELDKLKYLFRA